MGVIKTLQHKAKEIATTTQGKKEGPETSQNITSNRPSLGLYQDLQETKSWQGEGDITYDTWQHFCPHPVWSVKKNPENPLETEHSAHFKLSNTLRQKRVHQQDKTPRHEQSNVVFLTELSSTSILKKKLDTSLGTLKYVYWPEKIASLKEV